MTTTAITLNNQQTFPVGAAVSAYPATNWPAAGQPPSGAPVGSAAGNSAVTVASNGDIAFTGLTAGAVYYAVAQIGSEYRYVRFRVGDSTDLDPGLPVSKADLAASQSTIEQNTQTADYTLVLADAGKCVELNKATAITLTVPTNASVAFPVGTVIEVCQIGAGQVTIAAAGGVTLDSPSAKLKLTGQNSTAALRKRATNEWVVSGDLSA